jgi:two-component system phosphate regulon sensor histidine kinase PhoR
MKFLLKYRAIIIVYIVAFILTIIVDNVYFALIMMTFLIAYTLIDLSKKTLELSNNKDVANRTLEYQLEEIKKAQSDSEQVFMSLSKFIGSGVMLINRDGIITFANKDIQAYFTSIKTGQYISSIKSDEKFYEVVNQSYVLELKFDKVINISDQYFDITITPSFDDEGYNGCIVIVHDVTQSKIAEQYQKQFTADVSHELRTPLSAIKGFSEILMRPNVSKEDQEEFVQLIFKESSRMEYILQDLMIISRLDRIDFELELQIYNIKDILNETYQTLVPQIKAKKLSSNIDVENGLIKMDRVKISMVFLNIIKNAINYTDKGSIRIQGYVEDEMYVIKIIDTGMGIDSKNLENIFKRFFRVDKARSRDTGGSGLGLSISKNVVMRHGGVIFVESMIDKGSTFIVKLPLQLEEVKK